MVFSSCMLDTLSATGSSSLSFGSSMALFKWSQCSVSELHSLPQSSSPLAGWPAIYLFRRTFNTWVRPPGRSFADKAYGSGNFSDNLNAAAPSCWKFNQDALMTSSVSEMDPMADICLVWARDSFYVARRFWLPCHIS
jgi:hypothetical protein